MDGKKEVKRDSIAEILLKKKKSIPVLQETAQNIENPGPLAIEDQNILKEKIEEQAKGEYDLKEDTTKKGNKIITIDIRIKKIGQLFNSFDPSPFVEKDLDDDASEYIMTAVRENPLNAKMRILIHLPKFRKNKTPELELKQAIHNYFEYKEVIADRKMKTQFQEAERSLLVGISFLIFCLFSVEVIHKFFNNLFSLILAEGLTILGWVAMWKPINSVLYEWWPIKQEQKVYNKISEMEIDFVYE